MWPVKYLTLNCIQIILEIIVFLQKTLRRAIKKFSAQPSSIQNKIKIVFASYGSKAQNTTYTI